jgi:hypothetical protein
LRPKKPKNPHLRQLRSNTHTNSQPETIKNKKLPVAKRREVKYEIPDRNSKKIKPPSSEDSD